VKNNIFIFVDERKLQNQSIFSVGGLIKNIYLFNRALAENNLWCVLMNEGIWHRVIKDKYLPYCSVATWLRSTSFRLSSASQTWKNLFKFVHLIAHWLSWSPGSGYSVLIGKDMIMELGNTSILSQELISSLKQKNITFLYQARHFLLAVERE
jgi:hypothetical protein